MKMCIRCGENPVETDRQHLCPVCKRTSRAVRINGYRDRKLVHKKDRCENCGFVALNACQLDVDHIDGNRDNDSPEKLRTLCANCHRLKTYMDRDHMWTERSAEASPQLRLVG
jgi:hypothetical protein